MESLKYMISKIKGYKGPLIEVWQTNILIMPEFKKEIRFSVFDDSKNNVAISWLVAIAQKIK